MVLSYHSNGKPLLTISSPDFTSSIAMSIRFQSDDEVMQAAIDEAKRGLGCVEPNPLVGAIIVDNDRNQISVGYHQKFGGAHAEVNAISAANAVSPKATAGQQIFVTLEPCSHQGKTPPCADALIAAGFRKVVIGCQDPAEHVAGQGIAKLRSAGIEVEVGLLQEQAEDLIAPFRKLQLQKRPWVHAKWAMTLDGRIATRTGHSQWITNEDSRRHVHELRARMDAIITGAGTVRHDNPTLTARLPELKTPKSRTPLRIVLCRTTASVTPDSQLMRTLNDAPLLICAQNEAVDRVHMNKLKQLGADILLTEGDRTNMIQQLLEELGRRCLTNVMLEAGPGLLGTFFDSNHIDEVSVFIAPKFAGGSAARSPIGGVGFAEIPSTANLKNVSTKRFQDDLLIHGRVKF